MGRGSFPLKTAWQAQQQKRVYMPNRGGVSMQTRTNRHETRAQRFGRINRLLQVGNRPHMIKIKNRTPAVMTPTSGVPEAPPRTAEEQKAMEEKAKTPEKAPKGKYATPSYPDPRYPFKEGIHGRELAWGFKMGPGGKPFYTFPAQRKKFHTPA